MTKRDSAMLSAADEADEAERDTSGIRAVKTMVAPRSRRGTTPPGSATPEARKVREQPPEEVLRALDSRNPKVAISVLMKVYGKALLRSCLRMLRDPALAEDALQEVFVEAGKSLSTLEDPSLVKPWLHTIAKRRCILLIKRRCLMRDEQRSGTAAATVNHIDDSVDESPAPDDACDLEWTKAILAACLDELDPLDRSFVVQHHKNDVPVPELVVQSGLKLSTVKMKIHRALRQVRACLESKGVGP